MEQQQGITETVLNRIMKSPLGQKIRQEVATEDLAERQALVDQITALDSQQARELPSLLEAAEKTEAKVETERANLKRTIQAHAGAVEAQRGRAHELEGQKNRLRHELRASAGPEIDDFLSELRDDQDALSHAVTSHTVRGDDGVTTFFSNKASVDARREALRYARRLAEELKEAAVEDLPAALNRIRASIPDVGVAVKVSEEPWRPGR